MDSATELARTLNALGTYRHVSFVLVEGTRIENLFRKVFFAKVPNLDSDVRKNLFDFPAPIVTHAHRLYVAQAFNLIKPTLVEDLHFIRKVRNAFAHSNDTMTFEHKRVLKHVHEARNWIPSNDPYMFFVQKTRLVQQALEREIAR